MVLKSGIGAPEQKLTIEVADIDGVHINDVNILEPCQREVGQNLATQPASADDQDFALVPKEIFDLGNVRTDP